MNACFLTLGILLAVFGIVVWALRSGRMGALARKDLKGRNSAGLQGYQGLVESSGKIVIRGETWDYVSTEKLHPGDRIEVLFVEGFKVHVRKSVTKAETPGSSHV